MGGDVGAGQEDRPRTAEDEKPHAGLFSAGPPLVLPLEVDEGIGREA